MMKYFVSIIMLVFASGIYAQCSDAGICILGKHYSNEMLPRTSSASFSYVFGRSGENPDVNGTLNDLNIGSLRIDADINILKDTRLAIGMPYTFISGPLGQNNGAGDLIMAFTKSFKIEEIHSLSFSIGGRFATGNVNSPDSLPQRYMPGLGTNDLIVGASYQYQSYYFGIGYQKPFGRSRNYVTRLKRGDDILVRAGFFEQFNKVGFKAEILTIIKLQPFSILNTASTTESFVEIPGSNEPQVNLLATVTYKTSREIELVAQASLPFLSRDYNFDGLKRTISASASISYLFSLK